MQNLTTSPRGLALIESFEDFSPTVYTCPAGKLTIGFGHVVRPRDRFPKPLTLTDATALMHADLHLVEIYLTAKLPALTEQCRFDAVASFTFNCGIGNFDQSTLKTLLKAGNYAAAVGEFEKWVHVGSRVLHGLEIRRRCEKLMFTGCSDSVIETERRRLAALKGKS
jgi:lysozyme